ncbi:hypothetical protein FEP95_04747 [Burkholderia multivorans]|uniref:beta strand repeat-containing protein n=1 Tax=Burkholderia multivorans TaxID=87883 RepID=UPI0021C126D7|nr:hypothetical protein [Burkholderia multivorans]MDR8750783.1 hypothetical protein [Burkholderia multivorans]MDR8809659.1 hypothetical protein [Burkholderia multivorans]
MKKILVAALFAPLVALAQTYPSPTLNNLTVNGAFVGNTSVFSGQVSLGGAAGAEALRALTTASAVNWVQVQGGTTGNGATLSSQGSDSAVNLNVNAKGAASIVMSTGGGTQAVVSNTASANRYITLTGSNGGNPTIGASAGRVAISPGLDATPIGAVTASTGAFTTLSASSTISGTGFTNYLASPPAIGGTAANAGTFTNLGVTGTVNTLLTQTTNNIMTQSSGSIVNRLGDRIFVGAANAGSGNPGSTPNDWLTAFQKATGAIGFGDDEYSNFNALTNSDPLSLVGGVLAAQSLNSNMNRDYTGGQGFCLNNNATYLTNCWGLYGEGQQLTSTAGATYGGEFDVRSSVAAVNIDPYTTSTKQTVAVQVAAGAGYTSTQYAPSAAINIENNQAQFSKGIVFGYNALVGDTGTSGSAQAIASGYGQGWYWYGGSGVTTSFINSFTTTAATAMGMQFDPNAVDFVQSNGNFALHIVNTPSAVNYIAITPSATAVTPVISATGSDTNINLQLQGKGNGGALIQGTTAGSTPPAGYVGQLIKGSNTAVAITAGSTMSLGSISLTPGDWDVGGAVTFIPNGSTSITGFYAGSSTSSTALGALGSSVSQFYTGTAGQQQTVTIPDFQYTVTANTTVYMVVNVSTSSGNPTGNYYLWARRRD